MLPKSCNQILLAEDAFFLATRFLYPFSFPCSFFGGSKPYRSKHFLGGSKPPPYRSKHFLGGSKPYRSKHFLGGPEPVPYGIDESEL